MRLPLAAALCSLLGCEAGSAGEIHSGHVDRALAALRPDSPNTDELPPVFSPDEKVETFDSAGGQFRVHFTRAGENAVPPADSDGDSSPDYVELVAAEYDLVGDFYANELGFDRPPSDQMVADDHGGDGRFDVYLVDFSTTSDGSFREECPAAGATRCPGYMKQENDFVGHNYPSLSLATRILASHEYFHAVQAGYDAKAGSNLDEGTAVWASEQYDPSLDDLEGFIAGYLQRPDRGLAQEPSGPVDAFSYGMSLFFQFLGENYGRETIRELWETLRDEVAVDDADASWPAALDAVLKSKHDSSLAAAFREFQTWNLWTGTRAFVNVGYENAAKYPELTTKSVTLPFEDTAPRVFPLAAKWYSARIRSAGSVTLAIDSNEPVDGLWLTLARFGPDANAHEADQLDASKKRSITVDFEAGDTLFAAVVNTRLAGESLRPHVCVGSSKDVEACVGKGASTADRDAGADDADASSSKSSDDGGCSVITPGARGGAGPLVLAGLALVICRLQRRRRAESRRRARRSPSNET